MITSDPYHVCVLIRRVHLVYVRHFDVVERSLTKAVGDRLGPGLGVGFNRVTGMCTFFLDRTPANGRFHCLHQVCHLLITCVSTSPYRGGDLTTTAHMVEKLRTVF